MKDEDIPPTIKEAEEYARSDKFPTSSPYDGDPYRAKKLMLKLIEMIKRLIDKNSSIGVNKDED